MAILLAALLLLSSPLFALEEGRPRYVNKHGYAEDIVDSLLLDNEFFTTRQRLAKFEDGFFFLRETGDKTGTTDFTSSFDIPGNELRLWSKDRGRKLTLSDYSKGGLAPLTSELFLETDLCQLYLGQANQLLETEEGLYQKQELRPIEITKKEGGTYNVRMNFKANKGAKNLSWGLYSTKALLNLNDKEHQNLYQNYDLQNRAILAYEGYMYYREQLGEDVYYLIPSPYLVTNFYKGRETRLGNILGHVLLKLAAKNINEEGFFPVGPKSEWLQADYGIGPSYFDNRWNADLAIAMMKSLDRQYDYEIKGSYGLLINYFKKHIEKNSMETPNGGLLNYDYGMPGVTIATHTSLNHQLNLINMLFEAYQKEKKPEYLDYVRKLIRGLEYIGSGWIKEDGSLHYAYLTNGSLGYADYDLLTYNDALITRGYMERLGELKSDALVKIMERKLQWIENNGFGHLYE